MLVLLAAAGVLASMQLIGKESSVVAPLLPAKTAMETRGGRDQCLWCSCMRLAGGGSKKRTKPKGPKMRRKGKSRRILRMKRMSKNKPLVNEEEGLAKLIRYREIGLKIASAKLPTPRGRLLPGSGREAKNHNKTRSNDKDKRIPEWAKRMLINTSSNSTENEESNELRMAYFKNGFRELSRNASVSLSQLHKIIRGYGNATFVRRALVSSLSMENANLPRNHEKKKLLDDTNDLTLFELICLNRARLRYQQANVSSINDGTDKKQYPIMMDAFLDMSIVMPALESLRQSLYDPNSKNHSTSFPMTRRYYAMLGALGDQRRRVSRIIIGLRDTEDQFRGADEDSFNGQNHEIVELEERVREGRSKSVAGMLHLLKAGFNSFEIDGKEAERLASLFLRVCPKELKSKLVWLLKIRYPDADKPVERSKDISLRESRVRQDTRNKIRSALKRIGLARVDLLEGVYQGEDPDENEWFLEEFEMLKTHEYSTSGIRKRTREKKSNSVSPEQLKYWLTSDLGIENKSTETNAQDQGMSVKDAMELGLITKPITMSSDVVTSGLLASQSSASLRFSADALSALKSENAANRPHHPLDDESLYALEDDPDKREALRMFDKETLEAVRDMRKLGSSSHDSRNFGDENVNSLKSFGIKGSQDGKLKNKESQTPKDRQWAGYQEIIRRANALKKLPTGLTKEEFIQREIARLQGFKFVNFLKPGDKIGRMAIVDGRLIVANKGSIIVKRKGEGYQIVRRPKRNKEEQRAEEEKKEIADYHNIPRVLRFFQEIRSHFLQHKRARLVGAVGLEWYKIATMYENGTSIHTVQVPFSLLDQRAATAGFTTELQKKLSRISILCYDPLSFGLLSFTNNSVDTNAKTSELDNVLVDHSGQERGSIFFRSLIVETYGTKRIQRLRRTLQDIGQRHNVSGEAAAVQWVLSNPDISCAAVVISTEVGWTVSNLRESPNDQPRGYYFVGKALQQGIGVKSLLQMLELRMRTHEFGQISNALIQDAQKQDELSGLQHRLTVLLGNVGTQERGMARFLRKPKSHSELLRKRSEENRDKLKATVNKGRSLRKVRAEKKHNKVLRKILGQGITRSKNPLNGTRGGRGTKRREPRKHD